MAIRTIFYTSSQFLFSCQWNIPNFNKNGFSMKKKSCSLIDVELSVEYIDNVLNNLIIFDHEGKIKEEYIVVDQQNKGHIVIPPAFSDRYFQELEILDSIDIVYDIVSDKDIDRGIRGYYLIVRTPSKEVVELLNSSTGILVEHEDKPFMSQHEFNTYLEWHRLKGNLPTPKKSDIKKLDKNIKQIYKKWKKSKK